jgi:hypothetical protein
MLAILVFLSNKQNTYYQENINYSDNKTDYLGKIYYSFLSVINKIE